MGDISAEPSMEDILSSIKRIIAEEGDGPASPRPRRSPRPQQPSAPLPHALGRDRAVDADDGHADAAEVLELSERLIDPAPVEEEVAKRRAPVPSSESILSETAAEASRGALDSLSKLVVKPAAEPAAPVAETLEGMVRDMLRPMLREWLDAKLPGMVEDMVAREIARITQGR